MAVYRGFGSYRMLALALALLAGASYAAMRIVIDAPVRLSEGFNSDKPKIQRMGSGMLVVAYGDSPVNAQDVYDVKDARERKARDIFVRTCMPTSRGGCDDFSQWSPAQNVSNSALVSSITTDWRGVLGVAGPYPGDIDKVGIKAVGQAVVLSWVGKYCPDGDLAVSGLQPPAQRAIKYLERDARVIPFSCVWSAHSIDGGVSWSQPVQMSTGLRDAIQVSDTGRFNSGTKTGQHAFTWQEDPQGLKLGEAEGPGDGAAGALVNGGTDIWYASVTIDLSVSNSPGDDFVLARPVRLTDNWLGGHGYAGTNDVAVVPNPVLDAAGMPLGGGDLETGDAGASRANVAMVGSTAIAVYEETKAAKLPAVTGKFIRYHTFAYDAPAQVELAVGNGVIAVGTPGCVISDPLKNGRRARVLTQEPSEAGAGGMQVALFWREGSFNQGGPADIVLRRGIDGVRPENLVPAVDAACASSDYATVRLLGSARAENVSSNSPSATTLNLLDDTEMYPAENALAHRGLLRGADLWIGYSYTSDLNKLWAQQDNYDFWLRKLQLANGWSSPKNLTNLEDAHINVREPRLVGTPKGNAVACPTGIPSDASTSDPTLCSNTSVVYLAWGTQTNVPPGDPVGPQDLGVFISFSADGSETFASPARYSSANGALFEDDDSAFESQVVARSDGLQFFGVWNVLNLSLGTTQAMYAGGRLDDVPVVPGGPAPPPVEEPVGVGGCSTSGGRGGIDPTLWLLMVIGAGTIVLRGAPRRH